MMVAGAASGIEGAQQLESAHVRQSRVEQQQVGVAALDDVDGLGAAARFGDHIQVRPVVAQPMQLRAYGGLAVHDQRSHVFWSG